MNQPIHGENKNKILLKPRFRMEYDYSSKVILNKFKEKLNSSDCKYYSKQSGNLIFLDIPKVEEHFWSPQLQVEVVENKEHNKTIIKGILGPKPHVWTLFMFFHFAIALAFVVFFVMFYVKWSMNKDFQLYKYMLVILPLLSVSLYFIGQAGKKIAYKQMVELDNFLMKILDE